jgi:hypothetical protein
MTIDIMIMVFFAQACVTLVIYLGALTYYSVCDSGALTMKVIKTSMVVCTVFICLCMATGVLKFLLSLRC